MKPSWEVYSQGQEVIFKDRVIWWLLKKQNDGGKTIEIIWFPKIQMFKQVTPVLDFRFL